jgi:hypothetical protein
VLCNELVRPRIIPKPLREPSVAFQVLPHVPIAHPDELLSSWIERIGLFYGIGYLGARIILEPNRANNEHGQVDDIDSSASIRQLAMRWSGLPEKFVPVLLCRRDEEVLELSARLTYCPDCWNQDVKKDTSPYVRRSWATWFAVACWKHNKWLSAREPHGRYGSDLNGWAPVWQTNITWARGANVEHDPATALLASGLESHAIATPDCPWAEFKTDFDRLARTRSSGVIVLASAPELFGMRSSVWEALEIGRSRRITDAHLFGYRGSRPGWLAGRIASVVAAVEALRIAERRSAAFDTVRRVLLGNPGGQLLIEKFRGCHSRVE